MSLRKALQDVQDQVWSELHKLMQQYVDAEPEMIHPTYRHLIDTILECDDLMVAEEIHKKVIRKVEMQFLRMRGDKEIHLNTPEAFEQRARVADGFVKFHGGKGNFEVAEKQRQRAIDWRTKAAALRGSTYIVEAPEQLSEPVVHMAPPADPWRERQEPILLLEAEIVEPKKRVKARKEPKKRKKRA